jgi:Uma2 family endonuclease
MLSVLEKPIFRQRALPISVSSYHHLMEQNLVEERAELIRGVIVEKMRKSPLHVLLTDSLYEFFKAAVRDFWVRAEAPLTLCDSEPEPDISVVAGKRSDFLNSHPSTAKLVIEVAISTEEIDREKGLLYAEAGVEEYWLVLGEQRRVEVYLHPKAGAWSSMRTYAAHESIQAIAVPGVTVPLSDIFPGIK